MRDKFIITLTDVKGSRQVLLSQVVKKFALYFVMFVLLLIVSGALIISLMYDELDSLGQKRDDLIQKELTLKKYNADLQKEIDEKTAQFDAINDKVSNIEELIGLRVSESIDMDARLENISLTSAQQQQLFRSIPNGWVIENKGVTAKFGWRHHPVLKKDEFHRGIDLRAPIGTKLYAPADGVVEFAGLHSGSGFGNLIIINHNYGFKTQFAHLEKKMEVKVGEFVKRGQLIGYTGNSGLSTGPHLHYEIRFISRPLDPINFMEWNSANFDEIFEKENRVSWQSLLKTIIDPAPLLTQL